MLKNEGLEGWNSGLMLKNEGLEGSNSGLMLIEGLKDGIVD